MTEDNAIRIKVERFIDPAKLKDDMAYTLTDLSDAMMRQASLAVHYGVQQALAARQVNDLALRLEIVEAKRYKALRDAANAAGEKTTEAQLEKAVALTDRVVAIKLAINEAKSEDAIAKTAVEAFRQRRDMLIQHGASERKEMDGEVSVRRRQIAEEERLDASRRAVEIARSRNGQASQE